MRIGLPDGAASAAPPMIDEESAKTSATIQRVTTFMRNLPAVYSALRGASLCGASRCGFVILDEVVGRRRSPDVERVFHRVVLRAPLDVGRNEVDVVR